MKARTAQVLSADFRFFSTQRIYWISFILFSVFLLNTTYHQNKNKEPFDYHSQIWADQAGYYVYLPAAFYYGFNQKGFPDSVDIKTGFGFSFDKSTNRLKTKYTYGVALMELPFFLIGEVMTSLSEDEVKAFSVSNQWSIAYAAVFYLIIGLLFVSKIVIQRFNYLTAALTVLAIIYGTNLFYYGMRGVGMSHVYSFALFSSFTYLYLKTNYAKNLSISNSLLFGFIAGMIVLIRPINLLFFIFIGFLDIDNFKNYFNRIRAMFNGKTLLILLMILLILLPQFYYWKYAFGSFMVDTYPDEKFIWTRPMIFHSWFSPHNGLFPYGPAYFVVLLTSLYMALMRKRNGLMLSSMLLFLGYIFSCWYDWTFGCSLGARSYVEYLGILCIPLAFFTNRLLGIKFKKSLIIWLVYIFSVYANYRIMMACKECFYGSGAWDWAEYFKYFRWLQK